MCKAKVQDSDKLIKLKEEKRLTAKVCNCDGCNNIGVWDRERNMFYLSLGMCSMHHSRFKNHGDVNKVLQVMGEDRIKNLNYSLYLRIKNRCYNENSPDYPDYGARGIAMSDEWLNDFTAFDRDMGVRPSKKHSVDRRDNDLGYSKENCYWATPHQQAANKRNNNKIVGVSYHKRSSRWRADLMINAKSLNKRFNTEDEAIAQRKAWEEEYKIYE